MLTPRRLRLSPAIAIVAAALLAACLLAACGGDDDSSTGGGNTGVGPTVQRPSTEGEPRNIMLGFSSLPPERTTESYIGAFATAAQYADIISIQRTPPWEEFMPGGSVSPTTSDTTRLEVDLLDQYDDLKLLFAIDPTDGVVQRSRIANLPPSVDPTVGFNDPDLREGFIGYATYVAANYKPDYLALGVEINMLYERNPEQFDAFTSLYAEAFAAVKATSPDTKVFPTFQLEDLEGSFGTIHPPHWNVLDPFRPHMDALAISTYPFLTDLRSANELRVDYYSQLTTHFDGEILISETGYASAPVEGQTNVGTEEDQQTFLARILSDAEANGFSAVIWLAALDPAFVASGATAVFKDIGLRHSDGTNKLGWAAWEQWTRRPYQGDR